MIHQATVHDVRFRPAADLSVEGYRRDDLRVE
jgi:hypothetical protein